VLDAINRLPQLGESGARLKKLLEDKLVEHRKYIDKNGLDMPEILNWRWGI
jgi:xylulose-5-phosphate/fructose-6-phosphate phosphoketolase